MGFPLKKDYIDPDKLGTNIKIEPFTKNHILSSEEFFKGVELFFPLCSFSQASD